MMLDPANASRVWGLPAQFARGSHLVAAHRSPAANTQQLVSWPMSKLAARSRIGCVSKARSRAMSIARRFKGLHGVGLFMATPSSIISPTYLTAIAPSTAQKPIKIHATLLNHSTHWSKSDSSTT
jgi:hypothetical protein